MQRMKARRLVKLFDVDKNGKLSFDEFAGLVLQSPELMGTAVNVRTYFKRRNIPPPVTRLVRSVGIYPLPSHNWFAGVVPQSPELMGTAVN
eukprot:1185056-Prorocentrum_minimum.AAC.1